MKRHLLLATFLGSLTVLSSVLSPIPSATPDSVELIARVSREELQNRIRRDRRLLTPPLNSDPAENPIVRGVTALV
jgi:hypothetical protein